MSSVHQRLWPVASDLQSRAKIRRITESRQIYLAESRQQLADRLREMAVYSAAFTQDVFGSRGEILERSSGQVRLQRPDFKWVVDDPYPQVIVIQGDQLKVYDPDLEQLTLRPLDEALAGYSRLVADPGDVILGDRFRVARIAMNPESLSSSSPRHEETLYAEIRLLFRRSPVSAVWTFWIILARGRRSDLLRIHPCR